MIKIKLLNPNVSCKDAAERRGRPRGSDAAPRRQESTSGEELRGADDAGLAPALPDAASERRETHREARVRGHRTRAVQRAVSRVSRVGDTDASPAAAA